MHHRNFFAVWLTGSVDGVVDGGDDRTEGVLFRVCGGRYGGGCRVAGADGGRRGCDGGE